MITIHSLVENGKLKANAIYEFEAKDTYKIRVKVTDKDGLTFEKAGVLKIKSMPPVLEAYTTENVVYGRGFPSEENKPTITGGKATSFSSSPTLPWGLSLDNETGVITGTPTSVSGSRDYRITVTGPGGSTNLTIRIGVEERLPEYLDPPYGTSDPVVVTEGLAMVNAYPNLYGYSREYKLDNELPEGLTLNENSGYISGTPRDRTVESRAFWSFNEGNFRETSYAERDNDLYPVGNPSHSLETPDGQNLAVSFDGDGDSLHLREPFAFKTTDPWAVSFWAIRPENTHLGMIMGDRSDDNDYIWLSNSPAYGFSFRNTQGQNTNWTDSDLRAGFQNWNHYLLTADGQGSLDLYRNGEHLGTKTAVTSFEINTLGLAFESQNLSLKGRLDDVSIFNLALNATHARALYQQGKPIDISKGLALEPLLYEGVLTTTNSVGSVETPVSLKVVPQAQIIKFEANPGSFLYGESPELTLSWEILHAERAFFQGQEVPIKGSIKVSPNSSSVTSYKIYAVTGQGDDKDVPIVNLGPVYTVGPFNTSNVFDAQLAPELKDVDLADTFETANGQLEWVEQTNWLDGSNHNFVAASNNANYLYRKLTVSEGRKFQLNLATDDGVKVWLDSTLVYSSPLYGTHTPVLDLPAGDSDLLIKITNNGGNHSINFKSNAIPGYITEANLLVSLITLPKQALGPVRT